MHSWLGGGNAFGTGIKKENTLNRIQTSRNRNGWKNAIEKGEGPLRHLAPT